MKKALTKIYHILCWIGAGAGLGINGFAIYCWAIAPERMSYFLLIWLLVMELTGIYTCWLASMLAYSNRKKVTGWQLATDLAFFVLALPSIFFLILSIIDIIGEGWNFDAVLTLAGGIITPVAIITVCIFVFSRYLAYQSASEKK